MQNGKGSGLVIAIVVIVLLGLLGQCSGGSSSDNDSRRCSSCGRSFTNSADRRSIAYSSMCENCHDNYKFTQDLREEMKKYQERYGD